MAVRDSAVGCPHSPYRDRRRAVRANEARTLLRVPALWSPEVEGRLLRTPQTSPRAVLFSVIARSAHRCGQPVPG